MLIKLDITGDVKQVTHKGGESAINYIKSFQNAHALSVLLGNIYSEGQLMHTLMDNFHQGGKYSAQIASHQAKLRREETFTDQISLNILSLQTDDLNLDSSSGSIRNSERTHAVQIKCTFCGGNNNSAENASKGRERKRRRLAWLMFHPIEIQNIRLGNALDVDMNIT